MSSIFIIHGVGGTPEETWFPWLRSELEKLGHKVIVPQFPTPEGQTLENWLATLKNYEADLGPDSILVGHSLGGCFVLNVAELYPIKAAFLVAPVFGKIENIFEPTMRTFYQHEFNWEQIKAHCKEFTIFHSDNDPYLKLDQTEILAQKLGVQVTVIPGAGHINESAGYRKFELLLEQIRTHLEKEGDLA